MPLRHVVHLRGLKLAIPIRQVEPGAGAFLMHHFGRRHIHDLPASLAKTTAPVELLAVQEKPLIEQPDLGCGASADAQARADQPVHLLFGVVVSIDRKSTRLNSSHVRISYAVFCLKKKRNIETVISVRRESNKIKNTP